MIVLSASDEASKDRMQQDAAFLYNSICNKADLNYSDLFKSDSEMLRALMISRASKNFFDALEIISLRQFKNGANFKRDISPMMQ